MSEEAEVVGEGAAGDPDGPVVLLCGQLAAGCTEVGTRLARDLGLRLANTDSLFRTIVVDLHTSFEQVQQMVSHGYIVVDKTLRSMVLDELAKGGVVIEGRSALMGLDRPATLKVFVYRLSEERAVRVAERRKIEVEEAMEEIRISDEERRNLVRNLFKREWMDPSIYDIMISTSRLSFEDAVEVIKLALAKASERPR